MKILYYIVSILGVILFILSPLFKKKRDILITQSGAAACYFTIYIMKGAISGWLMEILEELKNIILLTYEKKKKKVPFIIYILLILSLILVAIFAYDGLVSLVPIIINVIYFISSYFKNPQYIRYSILICAFLWIIFNYSIGAYLIIFGNAFEIIFALYSILKYKKSTN